MDDLQSSEESSFVVEEVDAIIQPTLEKHLRDKVYNEQDVPQWIDDICSDCMQGLSQQKKPFKYIVTAVIFQKTGAGIHSCNSCFGDQATDGVHTVKWPLDKHKDHNRSLYCIVTVFGAGI